MFKRLKSRWKRGRSLIQGGGAEPPGQTPAVSEPAPTEDNDAESTGQTPAVSEPTPREKTGLFILHNSGTAVADIVAVHGLCGDPYDTWTEETSNKLWLRDFLPSQVPNTRIMSFGYDSLIAFSKSEIEIGDIAADLLNRLNDERDTPESKNRPVIFICHSLGGIVVKKAIILAHEQSRIYGGLLKMSKGIVFMGTPHHGADAASYGNFAARALKAIQMGTATNRNLISDLKKNSPALWQITQQFVERASTLMIKTFYELNKLGYMNSLIVEKDSAILNISSEWAAPIFADHRSMCKFASKDEQKYRPVWKAVKHLVDLLGRERYLYKVITQALLSAIEQGGSDQLLDHLPAVDQAGYKSRTQPSICSQPKFYWIFKDMDFELWRSANTGGTKVLWLSGPAECHISDASSRIVDLAKESPRGAQHLVLYFFCSTAPRTKISLGITFISTVIHQLACSPKLKGKVTAKFLCTLLDIVLREESLSSLEKSNFNADDSAEEVAKKILKMSSGDAYWCALRAVTDIQREQLEGLSFIIDGLDKAEQQNHEFVREIHQFIEYLRERPFRTRVLITSQPQAEIKRILGQLPCIEYGRESKECLNSLRFDNTRYEKISERHKGSLEWLWTYRSYLAWSSVERSDLLLIEGKPGSGKSTLIKYFHQSLLDQEPCERKIVASFYYSYREGKMQTNHFNMLRSVLYDILNQNEEFFFHFQPYYRQAAHDGGDDGGRPKWSYKSLKEILLSLTKNHPVSERLYLIVDAMDESDDTERIDVINFLHELCAARGPCIVKVFVASRPVTGLGDQTTKMIRLQDVNYFDILKFTESFLGPDLGFPPDIAHSATAYITENAQGVFVWVHLVREELLEYARDGYTKNQIFSFLKSLPTELEGIYERILMRLERGKELNIEVGQKMLQFVLFAYRPLGLDELRQALAIRGNSGSEFLCSDDSFESDLTYGIEKRVISCTGNFLEIKAGGDHRNGPGIVQAMHQTVREFLRPDGPAAQSRFRMNSNETHTRISVTCIHYLMLCTAKAASIDRVAGSRPWTSENFEDYARYLNGRPFLGYALEYVERHLQQCSRVAADSGLILQLHRKLNECSAGYIMEDWIPQAWGQMVPCHRRKGCGEKFRVELLHAATRMKYPQVVGALLTAGAEVESRLDGKTPLMVTAESGDLPTARVLLDRGALVRAKDGNRQIALHLAAANGHDTVVQELLDRGADKEAKDGNMQTALHLAAAYGHYPVARLLIGWGADKEAKNGKWQTAMHLAAVNGHSLVAGLLIERGAEKEAKDKEGQTALHLAAMNGHCPVASLLIEWGAEQEAKDKGGQTALHLAAMNGRCPVANLLIDQGADKEAEVEGNRTALHLAAANGDNPMVRLLVNRGANKKVDTLGWGALHTAAWNGHETTIQMLVESLDANKEERDRCGWTALHVAAMNGCDGASRWLIERLAVDKEAKDDMGWTALHFVAALGLGDTARLLIKTLGVNTDARNNKGETAQDLAQEW